MSLLDLVLRLKWSSIAERSTTHPHEISIQDGDGMTVLHWACCNDPPLQTIQILLQQDDTSCAALLRDSNGMTPLQNACACRASPEVISTLVQAVPESVPMADNEGWTALHYVCCNALNLGLSYSIAVSKVLLTADATIAHKKNEHGRTPLFLLCNMMEEELQPCVVNSRRLRNLMRADSNVRIEGIFCPLAQDMPSIANRFWELASMVLSAAPNGKVQSSRMHCIASLKECPAILRQLSLSYCSRLLRKQDDKGNTPLHIAAERIDKSSSCTLLSEMVLIDPAAAKIRNDDGLFPLNIVLQANDSWTKAHNELLRAHPVALESVCLKEQIYPYILARPTTSPTTVFELLKAKPSLIPQSEKGEAVVV